MWLKMSSEVIMTHFIMTHFFGYDGSYFQSAVSLKMHKSNYYKWFFFTRFGAEIGPQSQSEFPLNFPNPKFREKKL